MSNCVFVLSFRCMWFLLLRMNAGEHNLTYPLNTCDQVNAVGEPPTPTSDPSPGPSSRATTPQAVSSPSSSPSRLPSSPVDSEPFHWPDVHQLCSRYTGPGPGPAGHPPVGRSCSVPERMLELCTDGPGRLPWKPTATQPHPHHPPWDSAESQWGGGSQRRGGPTATEDGGSQPGPRLLCRWSSLDSVPAAASRPLHELQNLQDPVRPGHGTLPAQHKVKELTTAGSDVCLTEAQHGVSKRPAALHGNKKMESRIVRNLREKFQSLGSGS